MRQDRAVDALALITFTVLGGVLLALAAIAIFGIR